MKNLIKKITHIGNSIYRSFLWKKKKIKLNYGEILFREHRLWHRGTKNHSTNYREMVGIMFLKKNLERNNIINKTTKNIEIFSNIFGTTKRERIKEFVFFYFKFIIFFYKFLISIKFFGNLKLYLLTSIFEVAKRFFALL